MTTSPRPSGGYQCVVERGTARDTYSLEKRTSDAPAATMPAPTSESTAPRPSRQAAEAHLRAILEIMRDYARSPEIEHRGLLEPIRQALFYRLQALQQLGALSLLTFRDEIPAIGRLPREGL